MLLDIGLLFGGHPVDKCVRLIACDMS